MKEWERAREKERERDGRGRGSERREKRERSQSSDVSLDTVMSTRVGKNTSSDHHIIDSL